MSGRLPLAVGPAQAPLPQGSQAGPAAPHQAEERGLGKRAAAALSAARLALAVVIGVRLAFSPFTAAVGQPDALWLPRGIGLLFAAPPPVALVVALQVLGVLGAAGYVWRRRLPALVVAWACLLVLAGLRTSLGKILHNDVLLLGAAVPLLLAGSVAAEALAPRRRRRSLVGSLLAPLRRRWAGARAPASSEREAAARTGLDAAAAIVIISYLSAGWWKMLRSGPAWALSDNLRWSLAAGRGGSQWPALTDWLVGHPAACMALACGILALELGAALLWPQPRLVPAFVAATTAMHASTWLVLGLDYWAHLAAVALVLLPWARMRSR